MRSLSVYLGKNALGTRLNHLTELYWKKGKRVEGENDTNYYLYYLKSRSVLSMDSWFTSSREIGASLRKTKRQTTSLYKLFCVHFLDVGWQALFAS